MDVASEVSNGVVRWHIYCIECGYDLFGLNLAGRCPECGTEVSLSTRGDLLKFANPKWLKRIQRGIMMMYYTLTFGFLVGLAAGMAGAMTPGAGGPIFALLTLGVGVLTVGGVYLTTTRDPAGGPLPVGTTWRDLARAFAIINFIGILVSGAAEQVGLLGIMVPATIMGSLAALLVVFAYFSYAKTLATRIPDPKLGKSAGSVKWGLTIATVLVLPNLYIGLVQGAWGGGTSTPSGTGPTISDLVYVLAIIGTLLYLFFLIRALRLLLRYKKAIRTAITEAQGVADTSPWAAP